MKRYLVQSRTAVNMDGIARKRALDRELELERRQRLERRAESSAELERVERGQSRGLPPLSFHYASLTTSEA